jgi:hypothetical protein
MLGSHRGHCGLGSSVDYRIYGKGPSCNSSMLADDSDDEEDLSGWPAPKDIPMEVKALIERDDAEGLLDLLALREVW